MTSRGAQSAQKAAASGAPAAAMREHVEWVFFDAAGTLFRIRRPAGVIYATYAVRFGLNESAADGLGKRLERSFQDALRRMRPFETSDMPGEDLHAMEKRWWREVVETTFRRLPPVPRFDSFFEAVYEAFATDKCWALEPDCKKILADLRAGGYRLGVISNFDSRLERLLSSLGIGAHFEVVIVSNRAGYAKPDPRIFEVALSTAGVGPHCALHVGDDYRSDYLAAQKSGLKALLYDPLKRFSERSVDGRLRRLTDLAKLLL